MLKKFVNFNKRKAASVVLVGMLAVGMFGGTAYGAYSDSWNTYIQNGINKLYATFFPEIENKTEEKKETIVSQIKQDIQSNIQSAKAEIIKHKDHLIKENQRELDKYYKDMKKQAVATKNEAVKSEKESLNDAAKDVLEKAKDDIDAEIEKELKKLQ